MFPPGLTSRQRRDKANLLISNARATLELQMERGTVVNKVEIKRRKMKLQGI